MNQKRIGLLIVVVIGLIIVSGIGLQRFFMGKQTPVSLSSMNERVVAQPAKEKIIEQILISPSQIWRPIQDNARDTVVQIFAQVAEIDLLQPYKSPAQGTQFGSGFFINADGDIITNAHVIDQARSLWIQIPSLGKRIIDVELIGVSPERDLALLRVMPHDLEFIRQRLGKVPFLSLGDSDSVHRSDEVLALGYPLGQQSLKSTTGVISGFEQHFIQTSAALNPGNSGGPLINSKGEVIGVNEANVPSAQNVGYAIPINDLKIILPDLQKVKLLRKPFLGILFNNATESLTEYLGNPEPGGCYVAEVVAGSPLARAGILSGDMIYEINGYPIDMYGEMTVPWSEDKISIIDYVSRLTVGEDLRLVVYRAGKRKEFKVTFSLAELPIIHRIYPGYEPIDYEVFGGMVVMPLTLNHIQLLGPNATGLAKFAELGKQTEPVLVITHIFPSSQVHRTRTLLVGNTLNEVNGVKVRTLEDYRQALKKGFSTKFFTIRASDNVARASDNILVALEWDKVLAEEQRLAKDFRYPLGQAAKELLKLQNAKSLEVSAQE